MTYIAENTYKTVTATIPAAVFFIASKKYTFITTSYMTGIKLHKVVCVDFLLLTLSKQDEPLNKEHNAVCLLLVAKTRRIRTN